MNTLEQSNTLAYRLNKALMDATDQFCADHPRQVDIPIVLGAANIYIAGLVANAPSKQMALQTLADCHKIQQDLINSTPDSFFGKGLEQNPDQN